jgi:hypothetical protein
MDLSRILGLLREELKQIDAAIRKLERLGSVTSKKRERSPGWLVEARRTKAGTKTNIHRV